MPNEEQVADLNLVADDSTLRQAEEGNTTAAPADAGLVVPIGDDNPSISSVSQPSERPIYDWPERRPPHAFIMEFRERIYSLFGAQPVPPHVVESVSMKEMIYALQPSMLPYLPTVRETHEVITLRREAAIRGQNPYSQHT